MIYTLIVEDDPMVSSINENYLKKVDSFYLVGKVKNGEEAMNRIKLERVDLVLLDIYMPRLNGLELLRKIRAENHKLDVIILTAADLPAIIEEAMRLGVVDYILKPFDFYRFKNSLLTYKKRYDLFQNAKKINQESIDSLQASRKEKDEELPKGIDPVTLRLIRDALVKANTALTVEEIATEVNMSQLTVRKYLEHMAENREIQLNLKYSKAGRPKKMYSYLYT